MLSLETLCANAGLPRSVVEFLSDEGCSCGAVAMAATNYHTGVIRKTAGTSVWSFLVEAAGVEAAKKYFGAQPRRRSVPAATKPIAAPAAVRSSLPAARTVEERWDDVLSTLGLGKAEARRGERTGD